MSKYHLTEAYGNLYNPRKADETFYENLRFVDYLMQEEIEEVMESLLWEFMDYGNTLDESYNLIESVFSDDVILEEALCEARMSPQRMAQRQAERQATLQQVSGEKAQARKEARKAAVTGALRSAGKAVQGAATGAGSAAMGAMRAGKQAAADAYKRAKGLPGRAMAALKGLVRKGAATAIKQGRSTERAGKEAERTIITTTTTSGGGRGVAPSTQTTRTTSGGTKRRAIGGLLQKAGKAVAGAMKGKMSRGDYEQRKAGRAAAARSAVGEPFSSTSSGRPHGPHQQSTTRPQGPKAPAAQGPRRATSPASSARRYPTEPSGQTTLFTKPVPGKSAGANVKVPSGGQRRFGATRKPKKGGRQMPLNLKKAGYSETQRESVDFELLAQYILEDFIVEGYADNYEDAFEILENLSEESILELTEMYLEG
jgi:hypothetical protein